MLGLTRAASSGAQGGRMPTYVVLYKFTPDGIKNIRDSIKRAGSIRQENAAAGFKIRDVFWTQGQYDMVALVDAPSEERMMGAMLNVVSAGNVTSSTMRAFDATEMSRILATVPPLGGEEPSTPKREVAAATTAKASGRAARNGSARAAKNGVRTPARAGRR
jgi:uncharacterized protein with GYD domain